MSETISFIAIPIDLETKVILFMIWIFLCPVFPRKSIEIYIYVRRKHSFTSYPAAKYPKYNKLAVTYIQKNQWTFLMTPYGRRRWFPQ